MNKININFEILNYNVFEKRPAKAKSCCLWNLVKNIFYKIASFFCSTLSSSSSSSVSEKKRKYSKKNNTRVKSPILKKSFNSPVKSPSRIPTVEYPKRSASSGSVQKSPHSSIEGPPSPLIVKPSQASLYTEEYYSTLATERKKQFNEERLEIVKSYIDAYPPHITEKGKTVDLKTIKQFEEQDASGFYDRQLGEKRDASKEWALFNMLHDNNLSLQEKEKQIPLHVQNGASIYHGVLQAAISQNTSCDIIELMLNFLPEDQDINSPYPYYASPPLFIALDVFLVLLHQGAEEKAKTNILLIILKLIKKGAEKEANPMIFDQLLSRFSNILAYFESKDKDSVLFDFFIRILIENLKNRLGEIRKARKSLQPEECPRLTQILNFFNEFLPPEDGKGKIDESVKEKEAKDQLRALRLEFAKCYFSGTHPQPKSVNMWNLLAHNNSLWKTYGKFYLKDRKKQDILQSQLVQKFEESPQSVGGNLALFELMKAARANLEEMKGKLLPKEVYINSLKGLENLINVFKNNGALMDLKSPLSGLDVKEEFHQLIEDICQHLVKK